MTKRSAMLMAAGLVAALLVGATALSFGLSGGGSAQAETTTPEPIVRTIHRTVTVEKDAKGTTAPVEVVRVASDPTQSTTVSSDDGSDDGSDGFEHEDDGYEDDHEGEGSDDGSDHFQEGSEHSDEGEHEDD